MEDEEYVSFEEAYGEIRSVLLQTVADNAEFPPLDVAVQFAVTSGHAAAGEPVVEDRENLIALAARVVRDYINELRS